MNVTNLDGVRSSTTTTQSGGDDRMEQIRELLVGDLNRQQNARLDALEERARAIEELLSRRLDAVSQRIDQLAADTGSERRSSFDELSRLVADLGESIRKIHSR